MKCKDCNKELSTSFIKVEPSRHVCSPNSINWIAKTEKEKYYEYYCSEECRKKLDKERYIFWAEVDRNASDSECFIHDHWEKDTIGRKMRVGHCAITGKEIKVEPLQPGDNSGQPKECYEHFSLRKSYK